MKRLNYDAKTNSLLLDITENNKCYWRYQDSRHGGTIPVGHQSEERIYDGDEPEYIEEGCSCYDNPFQLTEYLMNEYQDLDRTDIVLFKGTYMGVGADNEDIVYVNKEEDILYSLSLRDFYKFILQEYSHKYDFDEGFKESVLRKGEQNDR